MDCKESTPAYPGLQAIPCVWMRGGTSKAAFFHASDLPADAAARDALILSLMGHSEPRQIDGIGGGTPLTTKVAIVSTSSRPDCDVEYLFGQVVAGQSRVDYAPTCGNILAAVGPFALEEGLVAAKDDITVVSIYMVNTKSRCDAVIQTPDRQVAYHGDTAISGVPGTASPIELHFFDTIGSSCGALYPTGHAKDEFDGVAVTCIDNGMPVVLMQAADLGISGYESPAELNADTGLKARIESIRLQAGLAMGLGDVSSKVVPKMSLIAPAQEGGAVMTRTFIPHTCHEAIGVLGAASVASALIDPRAVGGDTYHAVAGINDLSVEHPTGEFTVRLTLAEDRLSIQSVALLRTARPLMRGVALTPNNK